MMILLSGALPAVAIGLFIILVSDNWFGKVMGTLVVLYGTFSAYCAGKFAQKHKSKGLRSMWTERQIDDNYPAEESTGPITRVVGKAHKAKTKCDRFKRYPDRFKPPKN